MQEAAKTVVREQNGGVVTLTISREKALNALSEAVLTDLGESFSQIAGDPSVRVVILTGAGDRAFVAGADISQMADMSQESALRFAERGHGLMNAIARLPQPVIAAVNGYALGGGTELALACDILYCSDKARFGQPEVLIGVMPGFGGTQRLPRLVGPSQAAEIILSGEQISAEEALRIGLVNGVFPKDELMPHCRKVAERIASRAPQAVALAKRALRQAQELPLSQGNQLEGRLFSELFDTADQKEGMRAFLDKRKATFTGK